MNELRRNPEEALIDCLQALESGASEADCLERYPEFAGELAPHLELRRRLALFQAPDPQPPAYAAAREALLARLLQPAAVPRNGRSLLDGGRGLLSTGLLRSPLARVAAASLAVFVLAGAALGTSAAAGVDQARHTLSALHILQSTSSGDQVQQPQPPESSSTPNGTVPSVGQNGNSGDDGSHAGSERESGGAVGSEPSEGQGDCAELPGSQPGESNRDGSEVECATVSPPAIAPGITPEVEDRQMPEPTEADQGSGENTEHPDAEQHSESWPSPHDENLSTPTPEAPSEDGQPSSESH